MPTLQIVFRAERQPDGSYRGTVTVPAVPGATSALVPDGSTPTGVTATAKAASKKAAVAKAAKLATAAMSNPMVQAVLPPQAKLALTAATKALKVGRKLRKLF